MALAKDGHEVLELAHARQFGLILMDLNMPRLGGEEFCRLYREQDGMTPVVLLTAANTVDVAAAVKACGAVAYIRKPFDIDDVIDTVRQHLASD